MTHHKLFLKPVYLTSTPQKWNTTKFEKKTFVFLQPILASLFLSQNRGVPSKKTMKHETPQTFFTARLLVSCPTKVEHHDFQKQSNMSYLYFIDRLVEFLRCWDFIELLGFFEELVYFIDKLLGFFY